MKQRIFSLGVPIILLFIVTLPLILPYFHSGFFPTHDGEWAVVRLSDMYREIRDGQIPARFSGNLNFGYGYPLFNFAYPLPYYLGLILYLLHLGLVNSIKILFAITVSLSAIFMYFASLRLWKNKFGAYISALLYVYLPYRMVDLYVRGSLGESLSSVLFPLILLSIIELRNKKSPLWSILLSVSFAFLVLTHNIMAVFFLLIIVAYLIYLFFFIKREQFYSIIVSLMLGIGLSAFFWLPAILEKHFILLSQIPIADRNLYYVTVQQLLFSPFGYGVPTDKDGFTYQLGFAQIAFFLSVLGFVVYQLIKRKNIKNEVSLFSGLVIIFLLLLFPFSSFVWEHTPLLSEINYPWTLLLPIGFLISFLAGALQIKNRVIQGVVLLGILINSVIIFQYAHPSVYVDRGDGFYFTNDATTTSSSELMPLTVKNKASSRPDKKVEVIKGNGTIEIFRNSSQELNFRANLEESSTIRVNTIYFPGWEWREGEKELDIDYSNPQGVMEATLPQGSHEVTVVLKDTSARRIGNILSLLSGVLIGVFGIILFRKRKKKK